MTQKDIITAYKKIDEIKNMKLPAAISLKVFMFKKRVKEFYDWQVEEERRIFAEYGASINDKNNVVIKDPAKIKEFTDEINALGNLEHEDVEKVDLPIDAFDTLTIEDIEALSTAFNFT